MHNFEGEVKALEKVKALEIAKIFWAIFFEMGLFLLFVFTVLRNQWPTYLVSFFTSIASF